MWPDEKMIDLGQMGNTTREMDAFVSQQPGVRRLSCRRQTELFSKRKPVAETRVPNIFDLNQGENKTPGPIMSVKIVATRYLFKLLNLPLFPGDSGGYASKNLSGWYGSR